METNCPRDNQAMTNCPIRLTLDDLDPDHHVLELLVSHSHVTPGQCLL